jgi:hypothetical protein
VTVPSDRKEPNDLERDYVSRQYHMHVIQVLVAERDAPCAECGHIDYREPNDELLLHVPGSLCTEQWKEAQS